MTPTTRLGRTMLLAGLPPVYVARTMRELSDHQNDLGDKSTIGFGDWDGLTKHLIFEYRRSRWIGRRPLLSYTVLPLLLLFAACFVYFAITLTPLLILYPELEVYDWAAQTMYETHPFVVILMNAIYLGGKVIPFAVATWIFFQLSKNSGRGVTWMLLATAVFSLVALFCVHSVLSIPTMPGSGSANLTFEIGDAEGIICGRREQLAQGLTPILITLALIFKSFRTREAFNLESMRPEFDQINAVSCVERY